MSPKIMRMVVVLPHPLGPRKPKTSPLIHGRIEIIDRAQALEIFGQPVGGKYLYGDISPPWLVMRL